MDRAPQPTADDESGLLLGRLQFHRDALVAKCKAMTNGQVRALTAAACG
jgi:hypothetical protein